MNNDNTSVPQAPPLPAPRPLQRARDAAHRLFGYQSRAPSPSDSERVPQNFRQASLSAAQNSTASHKTGLEIKSLSINEKGTHALIGGKEIFRTIRVENGNCVQETDLRTAIRSSERNASGKRRDIYSIDIADVAWAKGDVGHFVAAATSSGKIILYDLGHAGIPAAQLHEHKQQVHKITFNPHKGNLLLSGSHDGTVRLWDVRDVKTQASALQARRKYSGQADGVRDVKWSPTDGMEFAFGTDSGWIQCWDIRNLGMAKVKIPAHSLACNIVDWHPDGKHILSAGLDKGVRFWDFSSNRTKRPSWEIKTPYPVLNARWRPSCESSFPQDGGARMCTQIVTAYDRENPVIHLWDLRRPAIPFREVVPYSSAATDLLWHSQDLLWTVGREGTFLQTDIQHAPKAIARRNLQSVAVSARGEATFVVQKRIQRRVPKLQPKLSSTSTTSALQNGNKLSISPDTSLLSRSWADDSVDQSFLTFIPSSPRKHSRSPSFSRMPHKLGIVLKLDEILNHRKSATPEQAAVRTQKLPFLANREVFTFFAKNYTLHLPPDTKPGETLLQAVQEAFKNNALSARHGGLYRLMQSWEIVGFATMGHLKQKTKLREKRQRSGEAHLVTAKDSVDLGHMAKKFLHHFLKSPVNSPASMRPISTIAHQLAHNESTSNVATPLARPVSAGRASGHNGLSKLPDPDHDEELALPPSLTAGVSHMSIQRPKLAQKQALTSDNLRDLHQEHTQHDGTERVDMIKRWSIESKMPLAGSHPLPPASNAPARPILQKHDSDESFAFLGESSSDSKGPSLSSSFVSSASAAQDMVAERPSRPRPIPNKKPAAVEPMLLEDPRLADGDKSPQDSKSLFGDEKTAAGNATGNISTLQRGCMQALDPHPDDHKFDSEEEKPFTLVEMLRELISYHSGKYGDVQTAAHLVSLLVPLLPPTHPLPATDQEMLVAHYAETFSSMGYLPDEVASLIDQHLTHIIQAGLNPLHLEAIVFTYHELLLANELFVEAAKVRKMSYPQFPSVYDDFIQDNVVHFACGKCGRQLGPSEKGLKCSRCENDRGACPICWLGTSPFGSGPSLFTACLVCGHSGHLDCMKMWFEQGEGACPTEGCLCDCAPGKWRDEKVRERERVVKERGHGHLRVRSDEWKARESKAVEGVRGALGGGSSA